jgi:uncharacterized membrane protein
MTAIIASAAAGYIASTFTALGLVIVIGVAFVYNLGTMPEQVIIHANINYITEILRQFPRGY